VRRNVGQEGGDRVVTALRAGGENGADDGGREQVGTEDVERAAPCRRRGRLAENLRLRHVGADVEDQQSRQQADEEQRAPGDFLRK
jgi:hypothetical protein